MTSRCISHGQIKEETPQVIMNFELVRRKEFPLCLLFFYFLFFLFPLISTHFFPFISSFLRWLSFEKSVITYNDWPVLINISFDKYRPTTMPFPIISFATSNGRRDIIGGTILVCLPWKCRSTAYHCPSIRPCTYRVRVSVSPRYADHGTTGFTIILPNDEGTLNAMYLFEHL